MYNKFIQISLSSAFFMGAILPLEAQNSCTEEDIKQCDNAFNQCMEQTKGNIERCMKEGTACINQCGGRP